MFDYLTRNILDDFFTPSLFSSDYNSMMKTDVTERENDYLLELELAGYTKEDIKMSLKNGYLKIEATRKKESSDESEGKTIRSERFYGVVSRTFYVGDVEESQIKASFNNGILEVSVPKKQKEIVNNEKYISID